MSELVKKEQIENVNLPAITSFFGDIQSFESGQRMAKMLAASDMVPDTYKGNVGNCVIALEISSRIGANILAVMQNLYIVYGKPAWASKFLIALINASKRFNGLRFILSGSGDDWGCVAWSNDANGNRLEGPRVTIGMAKAEGWHGKNGSKWKTMPELMLQYRAATYFSSLYAPDLSLGIPTQEEIIDIQAVEVKEPKKSRFEIPAETVNSDLPEVDPLAESLKGSPVTIEQLRAHLTVSDEEYLANPAKYINAILDKGM